MARHTQLRTTDSIDSDEVILLNSRIVDESDDLVLLEAPSGDARGIFRVRTNRERPLENKRWVKSTVMRESCWEGHPILSRYRAKRLPGTNLSSVQK